MPPATGADPVPAVELPVGRRATPAQRIGLGFEILGLYLRARWGLWRSDLPRTLLVMRGRRPSLAPVAPPATWPRLAAAVGRTLEPIPADSRCLVRSLVLTGILARRGVDARLVVGVRMEPTFAAHAWVEHDGISLLPTGEPEYARLVEL